MLNLKRPWRKNVLLILGISYGVTAGIFVVLVFKMQMNAATAYDIIQAPFMTLIGGSIAIAKDLVSLDSLEDKSVDGGSENNSPDQGEQVHSGS